MADSLSVRPRTAAAARPWRTAAAYPLAWAAAVRREQLLVGLITLAGLLLVGANALHFPSFTFLDDEGIYAGQAWAVLAEGRLTPYTYTYDHAPAGWLLLAAWMALTGGVHAFGGAVDSGRVLMVLLHVAMTPLLYRLARRLGCGVAGAALAATLFSLSPLAIFYERMLLLDNIMLFWLLVSLNLALDRRGRLSHLALSGLCFGAALLSKETALVLLPAFLLLLALGRRQHQGRFALGTWLLPMLCLVSWYPLYALLHGELFPARSIHFLFVQITSRPHVSLLGTLAWQLSRPGGGALNFSNEFWTLVRGDWLPRDAALMVGGVVATAVNLLRGLRDRRALVVGLLGLLPLAYLARGGLVLNYYILLAIPFFCLNVAVAASPLLTRLPAGIAGGVAPAMVAVVAAGYWHAGLLQPLYQEQPDGAGRAAVAWIKGHVPAQSRIITRDDLWIDLRSADAAGPAFPNVQSHWKVARDPAISSGVFHDDWRNVDYVILSKTCVPLPRPFRGWASLLDGPQTVDSQQAIPCYGPEGDFVLTDNTIALGAMAHAHKIQQWQSGTSLIELWQVDRAAAGRPSAGATP